MTGLESVVVERVAKEATGLLVGRVRRTLERRGHIAGDLSVHIETAIHPRIEHFSTLGILSELPPGVTDREVRQVVDSKTFLALAQQLIAAILVGAGDRAEARVKTALRVLFWTTIQPQLSRSAETEAYIDSLFFLMSGAAADMAKELPKRLRTPDGAIPWAQSTLLIATADSIERHVASLSEPSRPSRQQRQAWLDRYKKSFRGHHERLMLPDLDQRRTERIERLYVSPEIESRQTGETHDLDYVATTLDRTVILGDPGSGKSTTSTVLSLQAESVPFMILLREVDLLRSPQGFSVVGEIERRLKYVYQTPAPVGVVEELLLGGECFLVFDGLDELLVPGSRQRAAEVIEAASRAYPLSAMLVTSRQAAYSIASLDNATFDVWKLRPFSESAVERYVTSWFSEAGGLSGEALGKVVKQFMEKSESASDLRSNPLLLAFICVLYRGYNYIPRNRAELYRRCAELVLRDWDLSRGIIDDIAEFDEMQTALTSIAFTALTDPRYASGIPEEDVLRIGTEFMLQEVEADSLRAKELAKRLLNHCKGRGWIFAPAGRNQRDQTTYEFIHRSFLEYFTAWYLSRTSESPEDLGAKLFERLRAGQWEIVAQICLLLSKKNTSQGPSRLILAWLDALDQVNKDEAEAILNFIAEGTDGVPLNEEALTTFLSAVVRFRRRTQSSVDVLSRILSRPHRHRIAVATILPAIFAQEIDIEIGSVEARTSRGIRPNLEYAYANMWTLTHINWLARGIDPENEEIRAILLGRARAYQHHWTKQLATMSVDGTAADLAVIRGARTLNQIRPTSGSVSLYQRLFNRTERYGGLGPESLAAWFVETMAGRPRGEYFISLASKLLAELSEEFEDPDLSLRGFRIQPDFPVPGQALIRMAGTNALGHRFPVRRGLLFIIVGIVELLEVGGEFERADDSAMLALIESLGYNTPGDVPLSAFIDEWVAGRRSIWL